jgi:hypothetical protein
MEVKGGGIDPLEETEEFRADLFWHIDREKLVNRQG